MQRKRIQLGLIHVAVTMTLVPINSTLNRVMIKELALSATLVAVLASLPYLFSPIQVAIGSFADRNPIWGLRRTPYIVLGLVLCVTGVSIAPQAAFLMETNLTSGILLGTAAFGAWGMGYNFAAVSYLSLASEISGKNGRSRTIATMFFMMIIAIILTATMIGRLLADYSPDQLIRTFWIVAGIASILGLIGILGLEPRTEKPGPEAEHYSWGSMFQVLTSNKQVTRFFVYLVILLIAILGQDLLLEPYGAEAFTLPVDATTRITSIWGTAFLLSLVVAGILERRVTKRQVAIAGAWIALISFLVIALSGLISQLSVFYLGVVTLGIGTGLSTVSNLSLMLDMTIEGQVGLFIGAWGMANAISRLLGNLLTGALRDVFTNLSGNLIGGYLIVFLIEAALLVISLILLRKISVDAFRNNQNSQTLNLVERAAIAGDA